MAVVTWAARFPLVSILPTVLQPVLQRVPVLLGTLMVTGLATLLIAYCGDAAPDPPAEALAVPGRLARAWGEDRIG